jgi:hypothetical protein
LVKLAVSIVRNSLSPDSSGCSMLHVLGIHNNIH